MKILCYFEDNFSVTKQFILVSSVEVLVFATVALGSTLHQVNKMWSFFFWNTISKMTLDTWTCGDALQVHTFDAFKTSQLWPFQWLSSVLGGSDRVCLSKKWLVKGNRAAVIINNQLDTVFYIFHIYFCLFPGKASKSEWLSLLSGQKHFGC